MIRVGRRIAYHGIRHRSDSPNGPTLGQRSQGRTACSEECVAEATTNPAEARYASRPSANVSRGGYSPSADPRSLSATVVTHCRTQDVVGSTSMAWCAVDGQPPSVHRVVAELGSERRPRTRAVLLLGSDRRIMPLDLPSGPREIGGPVRAQSGTSTPLAPSRKRSILSYNAGVPRRIPCTALAKRGQEMAHTNLRVQA